MGGIHGWHSSGERIGETLHVQAEGLSGPRALRAGTFFVCSPVDPSDMMYELGLNFILVPFSSAIALICLESSSTYVPNSGGDMLVTNIRY